MDDVPPLGDFLAGEGQRYMARLKAKKPRAPRDPAKPKRAAPERDAQKQVVKWLRQWGCELTSTENELHGEQAKDAQARIRRASAAKARGKTPGWPDLTVVTRCGRVFFLEMKSDKGRLSDRQRIRHASLRERNQVVIVGRTIEGIRADLAAEGIRIEWRAALPAEGLRR
jgi:hypothetical protein